MTVSTHPPAHSPNELARRMGREIAARRREVGMTQDDVAAVLGVTAEGVRRWEQGKRWLTDEHLARLAEVLGVDRGYFMVEALRSHDVTFPEGEFVAGERTAILAALRDLTERLERLEVSRD